MSGSGAVAAIENLEFVWWVPLFIYSCIFIPSLLRIRKIHINLRILMANVIADCLLSVGSRLILRIMERYGTVATTNSSSVLCTIFSFCNVLFLLSGTGTLLFLCMERYIATFSKNYETRGGCLSLCSIVIKYLISALITAFIVFNTKDNNPTKNEDFCSFIDYHPKIVIFIYGLGIVSFLLGLFITLYLYAYNVRKQKRIGQDNLSKRFQFKENIAATRMLRYQMECYFGISLIGAPIAVLNYFIQEQSNTQDLFALLNQIVFVLYLFYTTFYLLHVTFYYDPFYFSLSKPLMDRFCCKIPLEDLEESSKDRLTVDKEGDVYFQQMSDMWGGPPISNQNATSRSTKKK